MSADPGRRRVGLRLRITLVAAVIVGIALAIGAALLIGLLRSRLDTAATRTATLRARDVAALAASGALPSRLALPGEETALVQVVDGSGRVIAATENIQGEDPISAVRPSGGRTIVLTIGNAPIQDAHRIRLVALAADTPEGTVTVYAAESLEQADETVSAITVVLVVGLPALIALVGGVTWWAVGRTLQPVQGITTTMAEITATDLHRRVPEPNTRDEIGQLAKTVNTTLRRLDAAVEQQRRFVADASHELRGPLATLRADLEISLTHPERTDWTVVAGDTLGDVERLQHLTDDLLLLARLDAQRAPHRVPVDLARVVTEALAGIRSSDITMTVWNLDSPAIVHGNPDQLHRLVRNLLQNAADHAESTMAVTVQPTPTGVQLVVADDGPGIPAEQREHVLERFVRLDTARTRDTGGTGLGLAIVHEVVSHHHGTVTITDTDPHGATLTVDLPTDAASGD